MDAVPSFPCTPAKPSGQILAADQARVGCRVILSYWTARATNSQTPLK
jgi:hypothetical protein